MSTQKNGRSPNQRSVDDDLLNRIRHGDRQAESSIWETYKEGVTQHIDFELQKRGELDQLGSAQDYTTDAYLMLLGQARLVGATMLKHEYTTIKGWLKQTALNFLRADHREDFRFDRDELLGLDGDESDDEPHAKVDTLEAEGATAFSDMIEKYPDELVREIMSEESDELQKLLRFKFMDGFSWAETAQLLQQLFPDRKPPFSESYSQKSYWDKQQKDDFKQKLVTLFKRYDYVLRRKK